MPDDIDRLLSDTSRRYWRPGDDADSIQGAYRQILLEEIQRHVPEVFGELERDVLPAFLDACEEYLCARPTNNAEILSDFPTLRYGATDERPVCRLALDGLLAWAKRWNMATLWFLDYAVACMHCTRLVKAATPTHDALVLAIHRPWGHSSWMMGRHPFNFELLGPEIPEGQDGLWNHQHPEGWRLDMGESWGTFEKRVNRAYIAYKKQYRAEMETLAECSGYTTAPGAKYVGYAQRKGTGGEGRREHFLWFIRHVVQGWSFHRIADERSPAIVADDETIRIAVRDIARRVGIQE